MLSIYNYRDPVKYLESYISYQKEQNSEFTLKNFSKSLGLTSSIQIIDVLNRKKKIKDKLIQGIIKHTLSDKSEIMYLQAIVARSKEDNEEKMRMYDLLIEEIRPSKLNTTSINYMDKLDLFSDWIYTAILSISELPNFDFTAPNIKNKLVKNIDSKKIEEAMFELFQAGLLIVNEQGKVEKKYSRSTNKRGTKARDLEQYYTMICDLAKETFDFSPSELEINMFSFPMDSKNIPLAKEIIAKCRNQLSRLSDEGEQDTVYQANLSLFPLIRKE